MSLPAVLPAARYLKQQPTVGLSVPVVVLYSRAYGARWEGMQRQVAEELHAVRVEPTGDRYHNIHMARPDLVVKLIEELPVGRQA
jgi:hypothetical protein